MDVQQSLQRDTFTLNLKAYDQGQAHAIVSTTSLYRAGLATDGWLVIDRGQSRDKVKPLAFEFKYVGDSSNGERQYEVLGLVLKGRVGELRQGYLDISRNGYLGLYETSGRRWTLAAGQRLRGTDDSVWHEFTLGLADADLPTVYQHYEDGENYLKTEAGEKLTLIGQFVTLS